MKSKFAPLLLAVTFLAAAPSAHAGFFGDLTKSLLATNTVAATNATTNIVSNAVAPALATTNRAAVAPATNSLLISGPATFLKSGTNSLLKSATTAALSQDQLVGGLKEALGKGVERAVSSLGRSGGFLTNLNVKILIPEKLQKVESALRLAGQGQLADDFIGSLNHAAEQAVPVAAPVFGDAIKNMSIADAQGLLSGGEDSATQFFRRTTQTNLAAKFLPIVQQATGSVGVTSRYKEMMGKFTALDTLSGLFGKSSPVKLDAADIDSYVTSKAMDGLFKVVAEEEKNIRANPVARTTSLLQSVFGAVKK
ncbi:MAG: hypothetical protein RL380_60 [Verrucomicrobiota bacterium]